MHENKEQKNMQKDFTGCRVTVQDARSPFYGMVGTTIKYRSADDSYLCEFTVPSGVTLKDIKLPFHEGNRYQVYLHKTLLNPITIYSV